MAKRDIKIYIKVTKLKFYWTLSQTELLCFKLDDMSENQSAYYLIAPQQVMILYLFNW